MNERASERVARLPGHTSSQRLRLGGHDWIAPAWLAPVGIDRTSCGGRPVDGVGAWG